MKIVIDTSVTKQATISLLDGTNIIAAKTGTDALVLVVELLRENGLTADQVEFELTDQSGSFTGLKVGASIVNAINFTKNKSEIIIPKYQAD